MATSKTDAVLKNVRLSFLHIFTPQTSDDGPAKYSATILIDKADIASCNSLNSAIAAAKEQGIATKWGGKAPAALSVGVHDGDGVRPSGEPFGEECKGKLVLTARANADRQPTIVDQYHTPVLDASAVYSGCYANALIRCYPYEAKGRKGIAFGLEIIMKVKDGEPLGAVRPTAADVFGAPEPSGTSVLDFGELF